MSIAENPLPLFGGSRLTPPRAELTARDRCDACGAQAYIALEMTFELVRTPAADEDPAIAELEAQLQVQDDVAAVGVTELLWCNAHYRAFEEKLREQGAVVIRDERHKLAALEGTLPVHPG